MIFGDRAVVACVVRQNETDYHNIRLFFRDGYEWKLLGWANEEAAKV